MRLVLDTNTALSGWLWGGTPGRLIDAAQEHRIELASSAALLAELQGVLMREKFAKQFTKRALTVGDASPLVTIDASRTRIRLLWLPRRRRLAGSTARPGASEWRRARWSTRWPGRS